MKVLVSGSSGFIGQALTRHLLNHGHDVMPLVRDRDRRGIYWNWETGALDRPLLEGFDAVIHLAGENVASRWNGEKKQRIRESRVHGTRFLVDVLQAAHTKPATFISASAIGFYGSRGKEVLTEDSQRGNTFLAGVCSEWEAAAKSAESAGIRSVQLRMGIALSTEGGAFVRVMKRFQIGAGGRLGHGHQYISWIALDDLLRIFDFALANPTLSGPVNAVAPNPLTNIEFTEKMGQALHVPTIIPVPAAMAHFAFGSEMSEELLLASDRVVPERLSAAGFQFNYPTFEQALAHILQK